MIGNVILAFGTAMAVAGVCLMVLAAAGVCGGIADTIQDWKRRR